MVLQVGSFTNYDNSVQKTFCLFSGKYLNTFVSESFAAENTADRIKNYQFSFVSFLCETNVFVYGF